jgi:hypothetical protein
VLLLLGGSLLGRFAFFYLQGRGQGNVQSLIIGSLLTASGIQAILTAFVADAVAANRRLLEGLRRTPPASSAVPRGSLDG